MQNLYPPCIVTAIGQGRGESSKYVLRQMAAVIANQNTPPIQAEDPFVFLAQKYNNFVPWAQGVLPQCMQPHLAKLNFLPVPAGLALIRIGLTKMMEKLPSVANSLDDLEEKWHATMEMKDTTIETKYDMLREGIEETAIAMKTFVCDVAGITGNDKKQMTTWLNGKLKKTADPKQNMIHMEQIYKLFRYVKLFILHLGLRVPVPVK